ncbi:MAG TPA: sigma-70 family RNA polymerase sigma factor [Streptosporangiaceae bacterium]|jgi:RNA polymerase sigma-70 factor (ECF subfamily)|nr:sigma-70 family RNA polymerase sigma factor [Streptosporangiaceae bacterium]
MILRNADSPAVSAAERFEALYTGSYQEITGYVRRRVPPDAADDVVAQVFTVAWRRFGQVPGPPQDRLWLFGVARNCAAEHHRAATRRLRLRTRLSQEPAAVAHVPGPGGPDHDPGPVLAALASLKPRDREALQLVLWDELSHAEAAAVLGCTVNAFELRYRRARNRVRDAIAAAWADAARGTSAMGTPAGHHRARAATPRMDQQ